MGALQISLLVGGGGILAIVAWMKVHSTRVERDAWGRAIDLVVNGNSSEKAIQQLAAEGVIDRTVNLTQATELLRRKVLVRNICKAAESLLHAGTPEAQLTSELIAKGMDPKLVHAIVQDKTHPPWARRHPIICVAIGTPLALVGVVVLIASLVLRDGNISGRFVTFPFAGAITKMLGVFICCLGIGLLICPFVRPNYLLETGECG